MIFRMIKKQQRKKPPRKYSVLFFSWFFILHLVLPHGLLAGYVLCIGDDGHVALERSSDDVSCSDKTENSLEALLHEHAGDCHTSEASHCGDCRDVALDSDCRDSQIRPSQHRVSPPNFHMLSRPGFLAPLPDITFAARISNLFRNNTFHLSLAALQSTVLRI